MRTTTIGMYAAMVVALVSAAPLPAQVSEQTPGWFPFPVSPLDSLENTPLDMSFLNQRPADSRISVKGPHFVNAEGKRVRFLGSNVTFAGAFPEKEAAPAIAARLAQLGMNVIRFHHMDARDIWLPGGTRLDPEKLDRLDWFIFQLRQNGIYANINLHVSRTYPGLKELNAPRTFRYGKILDIFYEPYIQLQEQYARDLFDRTNPYTGNKLSEEPAIAFVELNNENTLLNLNPKTLPQLPAPHREALNGLWRTWLRQHYSSAAEMLDGWNRDAIPLGPEMARDQAFEKGLEEWALEGEKAGVCTGEIVAGSEGKRAVRITMTQKGEVPWAYQFHQIGISLTEGQVYTFHFRAKADKPRSVSTSLRFAESPWTTLGLQQTCELDTEWREFTVSGAVKGILPEVLLRMSINLGDEPGTVWIEEISLRTGRQRFQPEAGQEPAEFDLPGPGWPDLAWADFRRFLVDTEQNYMRRMKTWLQETLGVKSLIVDTQASYGGYWGFYREAAIGDYIDMHAYWQHPHFPGIPWDGGNWNIPNTSMVAAASGSTFERLTHFRLADRPYSISEYNHPAPNDHAAELFPMLSAYAAHQDWDALYQFDYGNRDTAYHADKILGYFSLCTHSGQLAFAPIAALVFRQGLVPSATRETVLNVPLPVIDQRLTNGMPDYRSLAGSDLVSPQTLYGTRFAVRFPQTGDTVTLSKETGQAPDTPYIDADDMVWNPATEKPVFLVKAPAVRMAVGEIAGQRLELRDVVLTVGEFENSWACIAMAARDGKPLAESSSVLVAAAGRVENTNMEWNEDRTSVGKKWGSAPLVAQYIPLSLSLPGTAKPRITPLGTKGERLPELPVSGKPGAWEVRTDPQQASLWYAIER